MYAHDAAHVTPGDTRRLGPGHDLRLWNGAATGRAFRERRCVEVTRERDELAPGCFGARHELVHGGERGGRGRRPDRLDRHVTWWRQKADQDCLRLRPLGCRDGPTCVDVEHLALGA
jgi:hypothetical protein